MRSAHDEIVGRESRQAGVSLVDAAVSVVIILVASAIGIPQIQRSLAAARFGAAASSVSSTLQQARYEAIKRNTKIAWRAQTTANRITVWVDLNNNGVPDAGEPQLVLPAEVQSINPGGSLPAPTSMNLGTPQQPAGVVTFDSRGAVNYGAGAQAVYVIYFAYTNNPTYGYKAVTVQPLGRVKVWSASSGGAWHSP